MTYILPMTVRVITRATCEQMRLYEAAVWAHHGLFVSGADFDAAFGLMHTIEKAAQVYMLVISSTDDDIRAIAEGFGLKIREEFLGGDD